MPNLYRVTITGVDIMGSVSQEPWSVPTDPSSNFRQLYLTCKRYKMKIKRYKNIILFIKYYIKLSIWWF